MNLAWIERTALALAIRDSLPLTASLSATHLLGITLVGGAALVSGLRAAGLLLRDHSLEAVLRPAVRVMALGFLIAMTTGLLLVLPRVSGATRNGFFQLKMVLLLVALAGDWVGYRRLKRAQPSRPIALLASVAALGVIVFGAAFILLE